MHACVPRGNVSAAAVACLPACMRPTHRHRLQAPLRNKHQHTAAAGTHAHQVDRELDGTTVAHRRQRVLGAAEAQQVGQALLHLDARQHDAPGARHFSGDVAVGQHLADQDGWLGAGGQAGGAAAAEGGRMGGAACRPATAGGDARLRLWQAPGVQTGLARGHARLGRACKQWAAAAGGTPHPPSEELMVIAGCAQAGSRACKTSGEGIGVDSGWGRALGCRPFA